MFNPLDFLKKLFAPKNEVVDKIDGPFKVDGKLPAPVEPFFIRDDRGGYGGLCIPGDDLPDSIPRVDGPPTTAILEKSRLNYATLRSDPGEMDKFNFNELGKVEREAVSNASASITNGYDRDILLEGPVLTLFIKAGETRTIRGPVFQRVPAVFKEGELFNPSKFHIKAWGAYDVLRDMAAERTRSILRNEPPEKWATDVDFAAVSEILKVSKFTVQEL